MTVRWFGPSTQRNFAYPLATIPLGAACAYCQEPIKIGDSGFLVPHLIDKNKFDHLPYHQACWLRQIVGGLNHQLKLCHCFGGTLAADPPELSKRAAAEAAVRAWQSQINLTQARQTETPHDSPEN